jgi:hypothetical protein
MTVSIAMKKQIPKIITEYGYMMPLRCISEPKCLRQNIIYFVLIMTNIYPAIIFISAS